jgi:hypothetical protein
LINPNQFIKFSSKVCPKTKKPIASANKMAKKKPSAQVSFKNLLISNE